jgi:hypothetical protein
MFIVSEVNGKSVNSEFSKYFVPAKIKITQNNGKGKDTTTYTADVDNDTSSTVSNLKLYTDNYAGCATTGTVAGDTRCLVAHKDSLSE